LSLAATVCHPQISYSIVLSNHPLPFSSPSFRFSVRLMFHRCCFHGSRPHRAAGFSGPWLENRFVDHFETALGRSGGIGNGGASGGSRPTRPICLRAIFGPYAPPPPHIPNPSPRMLDNPSAFLYLKPDPFKEKIIVPLSNVLACACICV
jgi:hypothetical protein